MTIIPKFYFIDNELAWLSMLYFINIKAYIWFCSEFSLPPDINVNLIYRCNNVEYIDYINSDSDINYDTIEKLMSCNNDLIIKLIENNYIDIDIIIDKPLYKILLQYFLGYNNIVMYNWLLTHISNKNHEFIFDKQYLEDTLILCASHGSIESTSLLSKLYRKNFIFPYNNMYKEAALNNNIIYMFYLEHKITDSFRKTLMLNDYYDQIVYKYLENIMKVSLNM